MYHHNMRCGLTWHSQNSLRSPHVQTFCEAYINHPESNWKHLECMKLSSKTWLTRYIMWSKSHHGISYQMDNLYLTITFSQVFRGSVEHIKLLREITKGMTIFMGSDLNIYIARLHDDIVSERTLKCNI